MLLIHVRYPGIAECRLSLLAEREDEYLKRVFVFINTQVRCLIFEKLWIEFHHTPAEDKLKNFNWAPVLVIIAYYFIIPFTPWPASPARSPASEVARKANERVVAGVWGHSHQWGPG